MEFFFVFNLKKILKKYYKNFLFKIESLKLKYEKE